MKSSCLVGKTTIEFAMRQWTFLCYSKCPRCVGCGRCVSTHGGGGAMMGEIFEGEMHMGKK